MACPVILDCFEKTTAHALPQIAMQSSKVLKVMWTILFFGASAIFFVHLSQLVTKYLAEETSTTVAENVLNFEYPDIYLCDVRPLTPSVIMLPLVPGDNVFLKVLREIETITSYINNTKDSYKSKYFSLYWGTLKRSELGYTYRLYEDPNNYKFSDIITSDGNLNLSISYNFVSNHQYFVCEYNNLSLIENSSHLLKLIKLHYTDTYHLNKSDVYLYNNYRLEDLDFRTPPRRILGRQSSRIYFTEKNVYPHEGTPFVSVNPGDSTSISISMSRYTAVNTNSQPCREEDEYVNYVNKVGLQPNETIKLLRFKKTQMDCRLQKTLSYLLTNPNCSCIPYWFPVELKEYEQYPNCENLTYLIENNMESEILSKLKCGDMALDYLNNMSPSECAEHRPCVRYIYTTTTSISRMDPNAYQEKFYRAYNGKSQNMGVNLFYNEVNRITDPEKKMEFTNNNWVEIIYEPHAYFCSETVESLTYTLINLFSDLGGIVGLYLGASVLTFAEVINLAHEGINALIERKKLKKDLTEKTYQENIEESTKEVSL